MGVGRRQAYHQVVVSEQNVGLWYAHHMTAVRKGSEVEDAKTRTH
jgi:hypothetical protein